MSALGPTHVPSSRWLGAGTDAADAGTGMGSGAGAPPGTLGSERLVLPRFFFLTAADAAAEADDDDVNDGDTALLGAVEGSSVLGVILARHSCLWPRFQ